MVDERLNPDVAPDRLDPAAGVRRLNKLPLVIVGGLVMLIVVMLVVALQGRAKRQQQQAVQEAQLEALPDSREVYRGLLEDLEEEEEVVIDEAGMAVVETAPEEALPPVPVAPPPTAVELEAMKQRQEALREALNSPTAVALKPADGRAGAAVRAPVEPGPADRRRGRKTARVAAGGRRAGRRRGRPEPAGAQGAVH